MILTKCDCAAIHERWKWAEAHIVWCFDEDEILQFVQGPPGRHELTAPVTAGQCEYMGKEIARLRAALEHEYPQRLHQETKAKMQILKNALETIQSNDPETNRQHADEIANKALGDAFKDEHNNA